MTLYEFPPFLVLDESGHPAPGAIAEFYARDDTAFTTALDITDTGEVPIPNVTASDLGVGGGFKAEFPVVVCKSGSLPAFEMVSGGGILDALDDAVATAEQAVDDVAAYIADNPSDLPSAGRAASRVLTVGADGNTPAWSDPTLLTTVTWDNVIPKPPPLPPALHTHVTTALSDSTPTGRAVVTAADAAAARAAISAAPSTTVSFPGLSTTDPNKAAPGGHTHTATTVPFAPSGSITATDVQGAIVQASTMGSTGGTGRVDYRLYTSGAYPVRGTVAAGTWIIWRGPVWPTIGGLYMDASIDTYQATS